MWKYIVTAIGGVAVGVIFGIFLEKMLQRMKENKKYQSEKVLLETFGEPMYISRFRFDDLKNWIDNHVENISNEDKVALIRTKQNLFEKIGKNIEISAEIDNYLLIAIVSSNSDFKEHLLVKFESLDPVVNEKLNAGDGILIVEV